MKKILSALTALVLVLALLMGSACAWGGPNFDMDGFNEIFRSRSLVHYFDFNVPGPGEYGSVYAAVLQDGIIDVHEFAAKSGELYMFEMVNTIYYPFIGLNSTERAALENEIRGIYAAIDAEKFVDVSYSMQNDYLLIKIYYKNLDKKKNVRVLGEYGLVPEGTEVISYNDTVKNLEFSGYIEGWDSISTEY